MPDRNDKRNLLNTIHAFLYARKKAVTVAATLMIIAGFLLLCSGNTEAMILGSILLIVGFFPFAFIGQKWQ